jgi:hypothetical protein
MSERYNLSQSDTKESKRRRHSPEDIQELQRRAGDWGQSGGPGRAGIHHQADAAYKLSLDFFRLAIGGDFPRWLSIHSSVPHKTCHRRYKAGIARAAGAKPNRNLSGLLAEQREREQTPVPELDWGEDSD